MELSWIIPLFPLASFVISLVLGKRRKSVAVLLSIFLLFISFVLSTVVLFLQMTTGNFIQLFDWIPIGNSVIAFGYEINALNAMMLAIVSFISLLIHIYSLGYMSEDERISTFYAYLGLFTFAMLGLVLSPNLLQTYIFWELVGLGSFLLIGFYIQKDEAKAAAKKAFLMTRIGDIGLFVGMILLFWQVGSFNYSDIFTAVSSGVISESILILSGVLIFIGAIGKSGQFPLHSWLPDAMEGPTPVSALIHAATMVAAGVYLVATLFPLYESNEILLLTIAITGGFTAIFAATIGLVQNDIKRILAYSTVSQLGYMMLALGSAGYVAGVFHLTTHAFFKALLFLAAGSVIHATHTQNIQEMGGLWKKLKVTGPLFLIGTLAISGIPLFSGFFSKDEILLSAWAHGNTILFWMGVVTALLTSFYMFRLFFIVFAGEEKISKVHESHLVMTIPMAILAFFAVFIGYIQTHWFGTFLGDWLYRDNPFLTEHHTVSAYWIPFVVTGFSLAGIGLAYLIYIRMTLPKDWITGSIPFFYRITYNKYYIDEIYHYAIVKPTYFLSKTLQVIEKYTIDLVIEFTTKSTKYISNAVTKTQTGQTQVYIGIAFVGLSIILAIYVLVGGNN